MPPPSHHAAEGRALREDGPPSNDGSWDEYRIHVINSLNRIDNSLDRLWQALSEVKKDVTVLKIKLAVWSAAFGFVGASIPIVVDAMLRWIEVTGK